MAGRNPFPDNEVGVAVRLFNLHQGDDGFPQSGSQIAFKPSVAENLWLTDVKKVRKTTVNVGLKTTIGVATGAGHSLRDASRRAHKTIDGFSFEGIYLPASILIWSAENTRQAL